ncbi:MAG: MFS transporter [Clostridia bacterium]|nr:MFS transporter [Clostridia bacterium]
MEKLTDKRKIDATVFLFTMTYLVSYMTRINLGAVIQAIVEDTGMTKTMVSMAVTGSAVTYGVGQLLSGWIGDRVSPKKLVFLGLMTSVAMNILLIFCRDHYQMTAVWCVNGLAQAFMWPPMVKLMVCLFTASDYQHATTKVCWGSSLGTVIIYLVSPLAIMVASWRSLFVFTSAAGVIMALCWLKFCKEPQFEKFHEKPAHTPGRNREKGLLSPLLLAVMAAIVIQGALRDGVTTWMPSFVSETFHLSSEVSILSGVCLPLFAIFSLRAALWIYERKPGNPVRCAGWIFAAGALAALLLTFVSKGSPIASVACMTLLTGSMHGVNLMLICLLPPFVQRHGNVSTVSGVLNSCTYVGSAISTYGIALLSESAGWQVTAFVWFVIAALGAAICVVCSKVWK